MGDWCTYWVGRDSFGVLSGQAWPAQIHPHPFLTKIYAICHFFRLQFTCHLILWCRSQRHDVSSLELWKATVVWSWVCRSFFRPWSKIWFPKSQWVYYYLGLRKVLWNLLALAPPTLYTIRRFWIYLGPIQQCDTLKSWKDTSCLQYERISRCDALVRMS